jgi:hypothetical protein
LGKINLVGKNKPGWEKLTWLGKNLAGNNPRWKQATQEIRMLQTINVN